MLIRYMRHKENINTEFLQNDISRFGRVVRGISELKMQYNIENESEAETYNMFGIMKMDYREVLLHSPIICNLLNPNGSHSQGTLFYIKFIENVFSNEDAKVLSLIKPDNFHIVNEKRTYFGQMDIFIRNVDHSNPFVIIIENKIGAPDQKAQLQRYYEYAKSIYGLQDKDIRLLYLKPIKGDPSTVSLAADMLKSLKDLEILKTISYKDNIIPWLTICLPLIKAPVVKYTIQQYLHTLNKVCL